MSWIDFLSGLDFDHLLDSVLSMDDLSFIAARSLGKAPSPSLYKEAQSVPVCMRNRSWFRCASGRKDLSLSGNGRQSLYVMRIHFFCQPYASTLFQ